VSANAYDDLDWQGIAPLSLEYDVELLLGDLAIPLPWANHYSYYNENDSWSALTLRGYGDESYIIKPAEMTREWRRDHADDLYRQVHDTSLMRQMHGMRALCERLPAAKQRVRLMRLLPRGGELQRHTDLSDRECGTDDGQIMRLHFPIITNDRVRFTSWNLDGKAQNVHMDVGRGWYLDVRKPHQAVNGGTSDRVHLVIDVHANKAIRAMVLA
jgi:hypothetical protein